MNKIKSTSCLLGILGAFCIVSTVFGGSVVDVTAYLSHRDEVNNQITVGDNTSHITEHFKILVYEETVQAQGYDTPQEAFSSIQAK